MKHKTLTSWLLFDSILIILVGAFMTFFKDSNLFVFRSLIETTFWPNGVITDLGSQVFRSFMFSLCGVMMIIWGIIMFFVVKNAVAKKQKWAIDALLFAVLVWFPIDEYFSATYGVWYNVVFNIPFFLALIIPLALLRIQLKTK